MQVLLHNIISMIKYWAGVSNEVKRKRYLFKFYRSFKTGKNTQYSVTTEKGNMVEGVKISEGL